MKCLECLKWKMEVEGGRPIALDKLQKHCMKNCDNPALELEFRIFWTDLLHVDGGTSR